MNQHIGKNGNKSIIAYIIISFFLFQIAMIAFSTPVQGATTITVSLDGTKDYTSIQAAIDNASAGDTIYVYNGTYYEHLTIDKTLTLSGEQNTTTIIDGQQEEMSIVDITADNVNFSGFTLQNTSSSLSPIYCGVYIQSQSTNIYSNLISNTTYGITIINHNNKIFNNTFLYTARNIILIDTADNNTVYSNHISLNGPNRGFGIALSESSNNYIHHNTLMNGLFGLTLTSSNNNIFKHNIMENNSINFGITGSTISDYYNDIDTSNLVNELHIYYLINESDITIDSSSLAGIVYCINCTNMTIKDSNLHHAESGIAFFQTNHSHIENCTISRCDFGINLYDYAHNNTIKNNIVKNCTMDIAIGSYSSHNIINNNYIGWTINSPGLRVRDSDYNMITYNQFFNCKNAINIWNSKYTNIENNTINESRLEAILLYSSQEMASPAPTTHSITTISLTTH